MLLVPPEARGRGRRSGKVAGSDAASVDRAATQTRDNSHVLWAGVPCWVCKPVAASREQGAATASDVVSVRCIVVLKWVM